MVFRRLALVAVIATAAGCAGRPVAPESPQRVAAPEAEAAARGRRLAAGVCASCHAPGRTGASPMAAAPPFRDVARRQSLDRLEAALSEGLATSHPAMPAFAFRASEIDDLIAWLEELKREP